VPQRPSSAMGTLFLRSINECRLARGDFGALAAGLNLWWMCIYVMWSGKEKLRCNDTENGPWLTENESMPLRSF